MARGRSDPTAQSSRALLRRNIGPAVLVLAATMIAPGEGRSAEPPSTDSPLHVLRQRYPLRDWADDSGRNWIRAALVDIGQWNAYLQKSDGTPVVMLRERISEPDRQYIRRCLEEDAGGWFTRDVLPPQRVTAALNEVWSLPPQATAVQRARWDRLAGLASDQGRAGLALLHAAAWEREGRRAEALEAYRSLAGEGHEGPVACSARFAVNFAIGENGPQPDALWKFCREREAAAPRYGWFRSSNTWRWSTDRQAALSILAAQRADWLSVRFFSLVHDGAISYSLLPASYAYCAILLVLTVGVRLLTLPLQVQTASLNREMRGLAPQVRQLRVAFAGDIRGTNRALADLYRKEGIQPLRGCLPLLVECVFVISVLMAMDYYKPQLLLDEAQLLWISDVTKFSLSAVVVLAALESVKSMIMLSEQGQFGQGQRTGGSVGCSLAVFWLVILAVAWFWQWPAYVFIFWIFISLVGLVSTLILASIPPANAS